jgi:hypothetical protein
VFSAVISLNTKHGNTVGVHSVGDGDWDLVGHDTMSVGKWLLILIYSLLPWWWKQWILRNFVSDQSIWCYRVFKFFYKLCISKNVSREPTLTRFINKCAYLIDLGKWPSSQQPSTGCYPDNPFSYPSVNSTPKRNFHTFCFISTLVLRSRPRKLSQIIFCVFMITQRALQVQTTLSSVIWYS